MKKIVSTEEQQTTVESIKRNVTRNSPILVATYEKSVSLALPYVDYMGAKGFAFYDVKDNGVSFATLGDFDTFLNRINGVIANGSKTTYFVLDNIMEVAELQKKLEDDGG